MTEGRPLRMPSSEDFIKKIKFRKQFGIRARVAILTTKAQKNEIVKYRAEWPTQYKLIEARLSKTLEGLFVSIDHIGSTSVPDLASKNRIDVQITVSSIDDDFKRRFDAALMADGFQSSRTNEDHRPPGDTHSDDNWKKMYLVGLHPDFDFRSNVHIRVQGRANQIYALLFRDYLRTHRESAMAYQKFKEELIRFGIDDTERYSEIKDPVCDLIMVDARRWAKEIGWKCHRFECGVASRCHCDQCGIRLFECAAL